MARLMRFGKTLRTPATFQIKHQFLIWWLTQQRDKEAAQAVKRSPDTVAGLNVLIPHTDH